MAPFNFYRDELRVPTHTPGYPKMAPESIKSAPAPQQGYATDARKADTLVTQKGKSVAQARIEAFRYNDLDRDALRRCICKSIVPNTLEWKALADGLYTNFRSWRSDSVGCSVTMVRKEQWWPLFVSYASTARAFDNAKFSRSLLVSNSMTGMH